MATYIKQLADDLAHRFLVFGEEKVQDAQERIAVLREELDRLDPLSFAPDSRFDFVNLRREVRRLAAKPQDNWELRFRQSQGLHSQAAKYTGELEALQAGERGRSEQEVRRDLGGALAYQQMVEEERRKVEGLFRQVSQILDVWQGQASTTPAREFRFIQDAELRKIVERDYSELVRILVPELAYKSAVILAGSILEAILYDVLTQDPNRVRQAMAWSGAPKKKGGVKGITQDTHEDAWTLADLIKASVHLGLLPQDDADSIHKVLREYRNFVHPKKEIRGTLRCTEDEAGVAVGMLGRVIRHLEALHNKP